MQPTRTRSRAGDDRWHSFRPKALRAHWRHYFRHEIWGRSAVRGPRWRRIGRRLARHAYIVVVGFRDNAIGVRASALTYVTLLSLIPLLALTLSLSKGLGLQFALYRRLIESLSGGQNQVVERIFDYVNRTDFKALGSIGLALLVYTAIKMLGGIESAFNEIWGVAQGRPFHRKFSDYLSVLLVAPVLLVAATGLNASLSSNRLMASVLEVQFVSLAYKLLLRLAPLLVIWTAFTFAYIFVPYTKVRFIPGLTAGVVAGTLWQLAQWGYIQFQVGVSSYNAIYGTFASLPIFIVWLHLSWTIVLLGGQIAYAVQHQRNYSPPLAENSLSIAEREEAALLVLIEVGRRFKAGAGPPDVADLASSAGIPPRTMGLVVQLLIQAGLVARGEAPSAGLLPARDFMESDLMETLNLFRHQGLDRPPAEEDRIWLTVREIHRRLEACRSGSCEMTVADALREVPAAESGHGST